MITEGYVNNGVPVPTSKNGITLANVATVSVDNVVGRIKVEHP
jgi:hypothetical protein